MGDSNSNRSLNLKTKTASTISHSAEFFPNVAEKIETLFNDKKFCDITLVSKDDLHHIDAHKVMLCGASDYFLILLADPTTNRLKLQIDGKTLESVVYFIYTSTIELTTENVEDIFVAANQFELSQLIILCSDFIIKQLDVTNCLGICLFAEEQNLKELYKISEEFVCKNIEDIVEYDEFLKLDPSQLSKFLSSNDLRVDTEEDVFRILNSWINFDKLNREKSIDKIINHIRFPFLTPTFIASEIELSFKSVELEKHISRAYKWHLLPEFRLSLYTEKPLQLRNYKSLIMAISGLNSNGSILNVGLYYPSLKEWFYKTGVLGPAIGRQEFGSTSFEGKLIIAGGISNGIETCRVDCLDLKTFEWTSLVPLNSKRYNFGMVSLKGYVYAIGGYSEGNILKTVERYDPAEQKWSFVAPMNNESSIIHVSTTSNKICVSTKAIGYNSYLAEHNLYDPEIDVWNDGWLSTESDVIGTGMVSLFNNHFFVVVCRNRIERYNYLGKSVENSPIRSDNSIDSRCFKCESFGGRMIAYGNNIFQEYNPFSNEWHMMPQFKNNGEPFILTNR